VRVLPRTRRRRVRDYRNPSSPSVSAGQPLPSNCMVHVHAKPGLTEPVRHQARQQSGSGEGAGQDSMRSAHRHGRYGDNQDQCAKAPGVERRPGAILVPGCRDCCQAAGRGVSHADSCGRSVQRTDRDAVLDDVPTTPTDLKVTGWKPGWEPHGSTTFWFSGPERTTGRDEPEVTNGSERVRMPAQVSTDHKVSGV